MKNSGMLISSGKTFIKAKIWRENPQKIKRIMRITGKFFIMYSTFFKTVFQPSYSLLSTLGEYDFDNYVK